MGLIQPFAAVRPRPELAARICAPPYDVLSTEEARALAEGNPLSFLWVSKPEIEFPPHHDPYAPEVYARGREHFQRLLRAGALVQEKAPAYYLYQQRMGRHVQTGLVAVASCAAYLEGQIKKHELTRPDKEDDRLRHIEVVGAQTGPAFLVYRAQPALDDFIARKIAEYPEVEFTAPDGIHHAAWTLREPADLEFIQRAFAAIPALYIADGHHRTAAAARLHQKRGGGPAAWFLAVIFPHHQMQILPYNRVLKDLNGLTPAALWQRLHTVLEVLPGSSAQPAEKHELSLYVEGRWHRLRWKAGVTATSQAVERLDAALLQRLVLGPIFGIDNPRTSQRIAFIGGIRGTAELERLVNSGEYAAAFSLHPTTIEDLMQVADEGGIMPPKSTWFEPKLRDALFIHLV
ncbi:MAG: DUF1015 family protein [Verrucomicrobiae bacterium]|nr:DUF1015 family protein [Verrucomicrobiae bacterium]